MRRPQLSDKPIFQPNDAPAGGWDPLHAIATALREESAIVNGGTSLLSMNQPDAFDLFKDLISKLRRPGGFYLPNGACERVRRSLPEPTWGHRRRR